MNKTLPSADGPASSQAHSEVLQYVHLKVHSAYSLLEGAITIPRLAKLAVGNGFPALGLTDTNNLFGALEFSDKVAASGIQPIVGCTLQVDFGDRAQVNGLVRASANQARFQPAGALALIASSDVGYQTLMKLASRAFFRTAQRIPALRRAIVPYRDQARPRPWECDGWTAHVAGSQLSRPDIA